MGVVAGGTRVVVAMSGGVDSSVAAALLAREGYEVVGVTLQLRSCDDQVTTRSCCAADGIVQARSVAGALGVPHYVLDCRKEFAELVLRRAWNEYSRGRTPSPCLLCNREIKFGLLRSYASQIGALFVATGHYARAVDEGQGPVLKRAVDRRKDQSYFRSMLDPEQLRHILLPVGTLTKEAVRAIARDLRLSTAERGESQDACLVSEGLGLAETLRRLFGAPSCPGPVVGTRGEVLGRHNGIHQFTIGQRRGLGVALGSPAFVTAIYADTATVVVSTNAQDLYSDGLVAQETHWLDTPHSRCLAQIRSTHEAASARLEIGDRGEALLWFDRPQKAVTPGQAVAFFDGDQVLGGGWIERPLRRGTDSPGNSEEPAHGNHS